MKDLITVISLVIIVIILALLISFQKRHYLHDLQTQEEVYIIELNRLLKICKDNKRSIQAPEHKPDKRW